jgi:hypothetical protein
LSKWFQMMGSFVCLLLYFFRCSSNCHTHNHQLSVYLGRWLQRTTALDLAANRDWPLEPSNWNAPQKQK